MKKNLASTCLSILVFVLVCCFLTDTIRAQQKPRRYKLGPDSQRQDKVPQGTVTKHQWLESEIYPDTKRRYYVYVPAQYDENEPAALMVFQDGHAYVSESGDFRAPAVFDNLIHRGELPVTICVFVDPGHQQDALPEKPGWQPKPENRSIEYDTLSDAYAKFLLEEILPEVDDKYNITDDPEGRAICGMSSGGICAFTVAWQRPDQFGKVVSHVGSFTNILHGDTYPGIIRKTEMQAIRVYLQDGKHDLDNEHGNWPLANQQMVAALKYQNYDVRFDYGEGPHSGNHGGALFPDALRWLWRDYHGVKPKLAIMPEVQNAQWAVNWWMPRHEAKLAQRMAMKQVDLLMIGDSITHGWEDKGKETWDKYYAPRNVLNLGFSGDRTEHVIWRFQNGAIDDINPKLAVIMIGTNNTGHRKESPVHTAIGIKRVVAELQLRLPNTKVLLLDVFPRGADAEDELRKINTAVNEIIKDYADEKKIWLLSIGDKFLEDGNILPKTIMPDLLHPNDKGYEIWAEAMEPMIKKLMDEAEVEQGS
jgi:enterochelin esterase-like enzyme/lysophospholipase L1-like esterase